MERLVVRELESLRLYSVEIELCHVAQSATLLSFELGIIAPTLQDVSWAVPGWEYVLTSGLSSMCLCHTSHSSRVKITQMHLHPT